MYNNSFNNRYDNYNQKPYMARNMMVKKAEIPVQQPIIDDTIADTKTGYLTIGAFTALGALPVPNATITVYETLENGEQLTHAELLSDANGRVPDIELPVRYNPLDPYMSPEYYFTPYNLRVQARNFYTVNVMNLRIFPGIKTSYKIDMIPVIAGESGAPEQTFIIPSSPIDGLND
ncbi:MAG: hypothetical protein SA378_05160 [Sedimentibacter sp.]|uniref:hypothetical protein n=1 Tax=Sedimentibacter sp. TaxID=1960295 RepID=UPI00298179CC|nr:hypothetical protein [Sedimentibacter sp.]MDW5299511.1 hypothetical protein [Sedimentibacter sp.]